MIVIKNNNEIALMYAAGKIVARVFQELEQAIVPGVTTGQLDNLAAKIIKEEGAEPAFLGYRGFPGNICTSVNEELVHGIPGERWLNEGDIISIDVGAKYRGYYGDAARTFPVGKISKTAQSLIEVTRLSLQKALEQMWPGKYLSDISNSIQTYVEYKNFSVVRNYVGHGIGREMHEAPEVPNFGPPGRGPKLREGMVLAVEPMVNAGSWKVEVLDDNWTVVTADRSLCAHFENTIAIMNDGPQILTL